jgi:hypothetical protein
MALTYRDKGGSRTQIEVRSHELSIAHIGKDMLSSLRAAVRDGQYR